MSEGDLIEILIQKIDKISEKQDRMYDEIVDIKLTQVQHTASLDEHMRRTEIAEGNILTLDKEQEAIYDDIQPLKDFRSMCMGVVKFLGLGAAIAGAAVGIIKFFS